MVQCRYCSTCHIYKPPRYTVAALLSHCIYTIVILLLHCCYTDVSLLLHYCYTVDGEMVLAISTIHLGPLLQYCQTVVTLLSHCIYTVLTLSLHCCYTVVTLLLHCCYTVVTLLLHCCYTVVTLLLHCYYTVVTPLLHCCDTVFSICHIYKPPRYISIGSTAFFSKHFSVFVVFPLHLPRSNYFQSCTTWFPTLLPFDTPVTHVWPHGNNLEHHCDTIFTHSRASHCSDCDNCVKVKNYSCTLVLHYCYSVVKILWHFSYTLVTLYRNSTTTVRLWATVSGNAITAPSVHSLSVSSVNIDISAKNLLFWDHISLLLWYVKLLVPWVLWSHCLRSLCLLFARSIARQPICTLTQHCWSR
jgi:hypothetical protein